MISNNKYYNIFIINTITYYLAHVRGARIAHWSRGGLRVVDSRVRGYLVRVPLPPKSFLGVAYTYGVTQTVQIRGIIIATEHITDSRCLKKRTQTKKRNKNVKVDM